MVETQPIGAPVPGWTPPPRPTGEVMQGRYVRLEPLSADLHAALLARAFAGNDGLWTYLPWGPFSSASQFHRFIREIADDPGFVYYAVVASGEETPSGIATYLRIAPEAGSIEVGGLCFAPSLQRSRAATEAMYLMMADAFAAGYRRYEWKCDALNLASRRAAQRLGLSYEGVFRQATVVKGRNRDTAWFACIDKEWPALQEAFAAWLSPSNFDEGGRQRERLGDLTGLVRVASDPALQRG